MNEKYTCEICGIVFSKLKSLETHKYNKHRFYNKGVDFIIEKNKPLKSWLLKNIDTDAMIKVAECAESGDFDEDYSEENEEDLRKLALQWYAVAASFGNSKAEKEYEFKTGYKISDDEKIWFRKNFIKSRSYLCKRANSLPNQEK